MSLQLAVASYIYKHYAVKKNRKAAVVAKATVHKLGSVQRSKFAGRLEFSVGQWVI
jgi:CRISPR/Cas system-associated endoribonuclease Cas2